MRKIIILATLGAAIEMAGCDNAPRPVQSNANTAAAQTENEKPRTMIAHSSENQSPPTGNSETPGGKPKWSQGGNPIDTTELDIAITNADKTVKPKSADTTANKA